MSDPGADIVWDRDVVPSLGEPETNGAVPDEEPPVLRTRGVIWDRVRPVRWLWSRRVPLGLPSLLVGEEGVGKGTLAAWIIAKTTCGELDGDLHAQPTSVLIIGDEDSLPPS